MTQDGRWIQKYKDVMDFMEKNHRNPSRYDDNERGLYCNWIKHNKKMYNAGLLKEERTEKFKKLLELSELYRRKNQYE